MTDSLGTVQAPNITSDPGAIGNWKFSEVLLALRSSKVPDGRLFSPLAHRGFEWLSERDAIAIVGYLKSLGPEKHQIPKREVGTMEALEQRILGGSRNVAGYVPAIDAKHKAAYGRYLVDNVARCSVCHNGAASFLTSEQYMAGGKEITFDGTTKVAPALGGARLAQWSESELVRYLKTGTTPEARNSDPSFCPTPFFALGSNEDLESMAAYLRTVP